MFIFGPLWFVVIVLVIRYLVKLSNREKPVVRNIYYCPKCTAVVNYGTQFCASCGTPIALGRCSSCGGEVSEGARFCAQCGTTAIEQLAPGPSSAMKAAQQLAYDKTNRTFGLVILGIAGVVVLGIFSQIVFRWL
jgi:uncharacterized membrane protein YvbJ